MLLITCPLADEIGDIIVDECKFNIGQVQKFILQRQFSAPGVRNTTTVTNAALLATWSAFLAAVDDTKVQITPFISNPQFEPGAPIEFGSGNEVIDGQPEVVGFGPTQFTSVLRSQTSATIQSLKAYFGETLGVWMVTEHGYIICEADDPATPVNVYPIPIRQFVVGDRRIGGFDAPDENALNFSLPPDWSNKIIAINPTANFDPLTELAGS